MVKMAFLILIVASVIGAFMPSGPMPAARSGQPLIVVGPPQASQASAASVTSANSATDDGSGVIRLPRESDGHFYIDAKVNGAPVRFLVDTGATMIALSVQDAQNAAVPVEPGNFRVIARGASGDVMGARVQLGQMTLGGHTVTSVDAIVIDGGQQSLLGQTFLARFDSVEIHGDEMFLY